MRQIHRQVNVKLFSSYLHMGRNLKMVDNIKPSCQGYRTCHLKLHTMVCHRMKLYPVLHIHYNVEEEDGFEMVLVRAPPGAAESTAPGQIEWEKTVGSQVTAGEVVCRIRFKEERSLDIKTPVTGIVAVRRKNEGDTVAHGDELFKIRLDVSARVNTKKKRKKNKTKDYYEEEEEIVGRSGSLVKSGLKSSFLGSRTSESGGVDPYKPDTPSIEVQKIQSSTPEIQKTIATGNNMDPYKRDTAPFQSGMGLIPNACSKTVVYPISQLMTTINEVNMQDTIEFINKYSGVYEVQYGNKPCLRSIYIKTAAHALKLNKQLNIKLVNDERVESKELEITVAIRHLKVLVFHTVKNVEKMSYVDITRLIVEIEKQIAAGTYKSHKGERGFTISPEWEIGSIVGTPTHSKTCTLGIHSIVKRPIFEENRIVAYPMMYVSLTYDKKFIDDENAIEYLKKFKESMEDPRHILVHSS
ncbi:unnamed protein product [Nezara viridula]|uniref:Dihydrolipoamide acetyltransferase component of pyruvate dehydrogenase complex n=1 Tax=Nezara viridula TaxID=85310 RepID=A0A9P0HSE5_NEZVI|nr:unnamed protein product [Nezara viridula]